MYRKKCTIDSGKYYEERNQGRKGKRNWGIGDMLQCYIRKRGLRKERKEVGVGDGRKAIQISWERAF